MIYKISCNHNKELPIINALKAKNISLNKSEAKKDNIVLVHSKFKEIIQTNPLHNISLSSRINNEYSNLNKIIEESQKIAANRFGADHSFYLVNGCTSGIHAALMATSNPESTVLLSRNCHKSALGGLILSGARPNYIIPEYDIKNEIFHCISPKKLHNQLKNEKKDKFKIKAVFIVSPTYYGAVSNIKELSDICHEFGIPLIVDEAHGSHFSCHEMLPTNAINNGADISIQSTQKTLTSVTQTAILHLKSNLIKASEIEDAIQILQTKNRNKLLLATLEAAVQHSKNSKEFEEPILAAKEIENGIDKIEALSLVHKNIKLDLNNIKEFDPLRLCLNVSKWNKTGFEIFNILENEYQVIPEMATNKLIVCALGQGSAKNDSFKLISVLNELNQKYRSNDYIEKNEIKLNRTINVILTPREAFQSNKQFVKLEDSLNKISGEMVCPYPPGIPVIYPGELINQEILNYLIKNREKRNLSIVGPADNTLKSIRIINK